MFNQFELCPILFCYDSFLKLGHSGEFHSVDDEIYLCFVTNE